MSDNDDRRLHHEFSRYADSPIAFMAAPERAERFVEQAAPVAHAAKEHIDHLSPQLGRKLAQKYGDSPVAGISRTTGTLYEDASGGQQLRRDWAAVEGAAADVKQNFLAARTREAEGAREAKLQAAEADYAARQQQRIGMANLKASKPDQMLATAQEEAPKQQQWQRDAQQEVRQEQEQKWADARPRVAPAATEETQFQEGLKAMRAAEERVFDRMQHAREAELHRAAGAAVGATTAAAWQGESANIAESAAHLRDAAAELGSALVHGVGTLRHEVADSIGDTGHAVASVAHEVKEDVSDVAGKLLRRARETVDIGFVDEKAPIPHNSAEWDARSRQEADLGPHRASEAPRFAAREATGVDTAYARARDLLYDQAVPAAAAAPAERGRIGELYHEAKDTISERAHLTADSLARKAKDLAQEGRAKVEDVIGDGRHVARDASARAQDTYNTVAVRANAAVTGAQDTAGAAAAKLKSTYADAKVAAAETTGRAKDFARNAADKIENAAADTRASLRRTAATAADRVDTAADAARGTARNLDDRATPTLGLGYVDAEGMTVDAKRDVKDLYRDAKVQAASTARDVRIAADDTAAAAKASYRDAKNAFADRADRATDAARAAADDAKATFRDAKNALTDRVDRTADATRTAADDASYRAGAAYRDATSSLTHGAATAAEAARDATVDAGAKAKELYREAKETLKEGAAKVGDALESAGEKVHDLLVDATTAVRDATASRSEDLRRDNAPALTSAEAADQAAAAEAKAKAVYREAKETVKGGLHSIGEAIEAAADKVATVAKDAISDAREVAAQTWPDVQTSARRAADDTAAKATTTSARAATAADATARPDHDRHWWEGGVGDSVSGAAGVIHPTHRHQADNVNTASGFEGRSLNDQRYALGFAPPTHSAFAPLDERPLYLNAVREPWALMRRALGPGGSMYSPFAVHHALDMMDREIARTQASINLSHWTIGAGTALGLGSAYLLWAASPLLRGTAYATRPEAGTRAARRAIGAAHPRIPYTMARYAASPAGLIAGLVGMLMAGMTLPMEYMQLQANRRSLRHVQATRDSLADYSAAQDERELV